jgi:hypothetical protein
MSKDKVLTKICQQHIESIVRIFGVELVVTLGKALAGFISDLLDMPNLFDVSAPIVAHNCVYVARSNPSFPITSGAKRSSAEPSSLY